MLLGTITSPENPHIRYARSLKERKRVRYREKRYLLEGLRLVAQAWHTQKRLAFAFYTAEFAQLPEGQALLEEFATGEIKAWQVPPELLQRISDTVSPQGIVAVAPMPEPDPAEVERASLVLILDAIRDPGNLGTILRTAQAAGVEAVLLSRGCADPYAPKTVRAGMGAHLGLALFGQLGWQRIRDLVKGKQIVLADVQGELTPWEIDWTLPSALIIGNEAHGASPQARELAQLQAHLPMAAEAESLNAAIASGIFLFEARRQRLGISPR